MDQPLSNLNRQTLEQRTQSLGRDIFSRVRPVRVSPLRPRWWENRLMDWCMGDEALKIQMLRFVDVFPTLRRSASVTRLLDEYFPSADRRLPGVLRWGSGAAHGLPPARPVMAAAVRWGITRTARRFIVGSNVREAVAGLREIESRGMAFTVDILGEATISDEEAERYTQRYIDLIEGLAQDPLLGRAKPEWESWGPRVNVSVKLSALDANFDPIDPDGASNRIKAKLRRIFRTAQKHRAFINLDVEQYAYRDLTLRIFREILEEDEFDGWEHLGIAYQAYLKDAEPVLRKLLDWSRERRKKFTVRLVKGAYWDYETIHAIQYHWPIPVFQKKWQSDAQFEELILLLLSHHERVRTAPGSHNIRSVAHTLAAAELMGIPPERVEVQMLTGMGDEIKTALVELGYFLRVYTPFGQLIPGMAYLVRRILENTANESFLKMSLVQGTSIDELLRNPRETENQHHE